MSNNYKLKFTQAASDDLDQIYTYISGNLLAMQAANDLMDKIQKTFASSVAFIYARCYNMKT